MKKRRLPENGSRIRTDFEKLKEIYYENVGVPTCLGYYNMQYSLTERRYEYVRFRFCSKKQWMSNFLSSANGKCLLMCQFSYIYIITYYLRKMAQK